MIEVKELRIGAHVEHEGKRFPISVLYDEVIGTYMGKGEKGQPCIAGIGSDEINPIPITAALLADIGFEPVRKALGKPDEEWRMELDGYDIIVWKGLFVRPNREWSVQVDNWDYDWLGSTDVAYLHQLENFIYLCTGEELIKEDWQ